MTITAPAVDVRFLYRCHLSSSLPVAARVQKGLIVHMCARRGNIPFWSLGNVSERDVYIKCNQGHTGTIIFTGKVF
jgi:hypothetical protein